MKRRVISLITSLTLCLSLCPTWAVAAGPEPDTGLCAHHQAHTQECGYVPPAAGADCAHEHGDNCFTAEVSCVHEHTEDCYPQPEQDADCVPEPSLCEHECGEDSGCVIFTADCAHVHDGSCGYAEEDAGAPCMFVCHVCPVEALIDGLPCSVTPENRSWVEEKLGAILELYTELTEDEQEQLDLSLCLDLQAQLCGDNTPELLAIGTPSTYTVENDTTAKATFTVSAEYIFNTKESSYTVTTGDAIKVTNGGKLSLKGSSKGGVVSQKGAGVVVESGASLYVEDADLTVSGATYGLDIASDANVVLSGGTYTGGTAAIRVGDGELTDLLKKGYDYYDASGNTISGEALKNATTIVIDVVKPEITWKQNSYSVDYNGSPVEISGLLNITISNPDADAASLRGNLEYYYRKAGTDNFTKGLPTNAGTYEIKASLPELPVCKASETEQLLTLTINKIPALKTAPTATKPEYNRAPQNLVTTGALYEAEALKDVVIEFARAQAGPYDKNIPDETKAGSYEVWYRVADTENYYGITATKVDGVEIRRKIIASPKITLSSDKFSYNNSQQKPTVTVSDEVGTIAESEYEVTYSGGMVNVGTYTVTITTPASSNYVINNNNTRTFQIVAADQGNISITGTCADLYYGDTIQLGTTGGTGNGTVTWSLTGAADTEITQDGLLTVKDVGSPVTVTAKLEVPNYKTVEATWLFTAQPKPVTAVVTVDDKVYDGTKAVPAGKISARVKASDLVNGDDVTISGLAGTYDDANVGTNKTVTLNSDGASVGGADAGKYSVSYPETVNGGITAKEVAVTVALSGHDLKTDDGYYYFYDGSEKTPAVTVTYVDGSTITIPASNYTVSYGSNKNVGTTATVTVTAKDGGNYSFSAVTESFKIKKAGAELTSTPLAKDLTYTGAKQELVTAGVATGGTVVYSLTKTGTYDKKIPEGTNAGTYTVYYMVKGDDNHNDTGASVTSVTIKPKQITAAITLNPASYTYDGTAKKPAVTVKDGSTAIATTEYNVFYSNNTNAGTATVTVSDANGGNYIVSGTAEFTIEKAPATVYPPVGKMGLPYNGTAQELITRGSSPHGKMLYSRDNVNYFDEAPTAMEVDNYAVYYKVLGDGNHNDSVAATVNASIIKNTVNNPTITLYPTTFRYNGGHQEPDIKVHDDKGLLIAKSEYEVTYKGDNTDSENPVDVDTYAVTITTPASSNYVINSNNTRTFKIVPTDQEVLSITGMRDQVYYGDTIQLSTTGGTGNGTVSWSVTGGGTITPGGLLTVSDTGGPFTVTAERSTGGDNYNKISATWEFSANAKPVTAVLTGVDRVYSAGNKSATVKAEVKDSDLVSGDSVRIEDMTGEFDDDNAGMNKTITINSPPTVTGTNYGKYDITIPKTATASILKANTDAPQVTEKSLTYDGTAQELVTGEADTLYSETRDGVYTTTVPTGTNAGIYDVWYKVPSDANHNESDPQLQRVTIGPNKGTPTVACSPREFTFDRTPKTPAITVSVGTLEIPASEYTVVIFPENRTAVGKYKVTVKDKQGGNYEFADVVVDEAFEIVAAGQDPLTIVAVKPDNVCYGDSFRLSATGGSGSGAIQWSIGETEVASVSADGVVTVSGVGAFTVKASRATDGSYSESNEDTVSFNAKPKPITPVVTAADKSYDGTDTATLTASWEPGALVNGDTLSIDSVSGSFATADVGTNKQVKNISGTVSGTNADKYMITWPVIATASIYKVDAKLAAKPQAKTGLVSDGEEHPLLDIGGATVGGIGVVEYSLSEKGEYSADIPTAVEAGKYEVWYRVADSVNYNGIAPAFVTVEIKEGSAEPPEPQPPEPQPPEPPDPETGSSSGGSTYSSTSSTNYSLITDNTGAVSAPMPASVSNGTAKSVMSAAAGSSLVRAAAASQSTNVVIKPEITGDVTKTEVSIPASTVGRLGSETSADLTVSTPIAAVTLPNASLDTLSGAGGAVSVVTEQQSENAVSLTLTADGKRVDEVPGGVTLTIPVEDAAPGTVAVVVHEDGTRETVRKAVPGNGELSVPLSGSATVEIVDNSKEFDDVSGTDWEADAVAFASAHELFNGTSETTFSPDQPMSRAMLATVLYNLEGHPAQGLTSEFSDVSSDAWYAQSVAWATENGITNGYEDGQFGPDENVTREQFAVMLWRYAGSPAADGQILGFTDADQVSDYAAEALCWATAKGILSGYGDGRLDPGGLATRAEAAQMLKNFMVNV